MKKFIFEYAISNGWLMYPDLTNRSVTHLDNPTILPITKVINAAFQDIVSSKSPNMNYAAIGALKKY